MFDSDDRIPFLLSLSLFQSWKSCFVGAGFLSGSESILLDDINSLMRKSACYHEERWEEEKSYHYDGMIYKHEKLRKRNSDWSSFAEGTLGNCPMSSRV